jgi:hypothetical protein
MIFVGAATRDDINLHWLRSEGWKLPLSHESRFLVDSPDLNDPAQNEARSRILRARRSYILDAIPGDARYRHVQVEGHDLSHLFILTCWDWFLDTLAERSN